ncbi:MAG: TonB-dependent receptor [Gammaproteobacteria bacterium]|nr:TonB-dependent receptor [Gammaproteobacteria bacterium]MBV9698275.1 TonB-dependent receptor [Gammaproteobacteria bacterium]
MGRPKPYKLLCGAALLLSAAYPPVRAAESDSPPESSVRSLSEVVVTARRREESLLDVPVAETVRSGVELEAQTALRFEDLAEGVPNMLAFRSARSASALEVTLRGQTALPSSIVYDPAVGLYIDGVYVANGQAAMGTLLDIDNVEIVRGAQGTLFGRNNTGGSISLHTRRPELNQYGAEVSLAGGNQRLFQDRAVLNVPLGSTLAVRFAYQGDQHRGWGSSDVTGQDDFMNQHRYQARGSALWQPAQGFEAQLSFERFEAREAGALLHPLPGTLAASLPGDTVPADFYQTDTGKLQHDNARTDAWTLRLTSRLTADVDLQLIAGYRELHADNDYDGDAQAAPIADVRLLATSFQKSVEWQATGKTGRLSWVAGLYWFHDHGSADSTLAPGLSAPVPTLDLNSVDNRSRAAYVHGEWQLTAPWSVAAGARWTEDRRTLIDDAYADFSQFGQPPFCTIVDAANPLQPVPVGIETGGPCPLIYKDVRFHYWSWELSSRYRLSEQLMAYARSGRAQRSGGWNIPLNTLQDAPFKPEQLTDLEVGFKASGLGGGRFNGTAAAFTGDYQDLQRLLAKLIGNTPTTIVINAGQARVSGLELEGDAALGGGVTLRGSFGWTDAKYRRFTDAFGNDVSNNRFYMTPRLEASLSGIYTAPVAVGQLMLRADYWWRDAVEFNVLNDFNRQGAVGLLNARAALTTLRDGALELALFGTNLGDRRYAYIGGTIVNPGGQPVASWQAAADRRLYGIELTCRLAARQ